MHYLVVFFLSIISSDIFAGTQSSAVLSANEMIKLLSGLLLVLFVILLLSWLVKRFNVVQLSSSKGFTTIASMTLGSKERMMLIKVGTRYLLVGIGSSSVTTLHDFGEQLPNGFEGENKPSFPELLKSALRK